MFELSEALASFVPSLPSGERKTPVLLRKKYRRALELSIGIPDGWTATLPAAPVKLTSKLGEYELSWTLVGKRIEVRARFELYQPIIPPSDYRELLELFEGVRRAESTAIVLERSAT